MKKRSKKPGIPVHHLTQSSFLLLTIEEADDETFDGLHRHDFFELIWFTKAGKNSTVEIDFISYGVHNNTVCVVTPGQVFRMLRSKQEGYVMAFSKELFDELLVAIPSYTTGMLPRVLNADAFRPAESLIQLIKDEHKTGNRTPLMKAYLKAFLIHMVPPTNEPIIGEERIDMLFKLIDQNYLKQKDLDFYASYFNISVKRLNEITKKLRNQTVKELISERIILEAKREISFGKLSFKEIAYKLGFIDPAYFSRYFKAQTKLTAAEFKASLNSFRIK